MKYLLDVFSDWPVFGQLLSGDILKSSPNIIGFKNS